MRHYIDMEFIEDGRTIRMLSIGIAADDGREYYAVNSDYVGYDLATEKHLLPEDTPQWIWDNVVPHLGIPTGVAYRPSHQIRNDILQFVGESPLFYGYYADYDWVCLCRLFGAMIDLPKGWPMYCRDIKQMADQCSVMDGGKFRLPERSAADGVEHNALADARWTRRAHRAITTYANENWMLMPIGANPKVGRPDELDVPML